MDHGVVKKLFVFVDGKHFMKSYVCSRWSYCKMYINLPQQDTFSNIVVPLYLDNQSRNYTHSYRD